MEIWESLEFGVLAMSLRSVPTKSPEEIEAIQRSRLQELVAHACDNSEFFREKFAHIDRSSFQLTNLPTSSKSELMDNFERALTVDDVRREEVEEFFKDQGNIGKYFRDKYVLSHTSGTQGQPLLLVQAKDNIELLFALQAARGHSDGLSVWEAAKRFVSPARLAAVLLKRGFYPSGCAFEYMPEGAKSYLNVLRVTLMDEDLVDRLAEFRPTHLTAYASVLHELARHIESGRLTLKPELEQIVNISERLPPQARKRYAEVFDAPIFDDYAMGECLFLTNGCVKSGGMHVNADWAILEVVDENDQPVPAGTKGAKVLLTNLANRVQPFIRYKIGDIVTMADKPCGCGSNLPLIARIEGRDSAVFWIEGDGGLRPMPSAMIETALGHITEIREYQVVQEDPHTFLIRVEPLPGASPGDEHVGQIVRKQLEDYGLGGQLNVNVETAERLVPEDGKKFERAISKVKPPDKQG